jgi:CRISPR-associated endoribonuclease Cas6
MRISLTLSCPKGSHIPLNYQYEISAWVYRTLGRADPAFAEWLHGQGYALSGNKAFKLFTFSHIDIEPPFKIVPSNGVISVGSGIVSLQLSFLLNQPLEHFVAGIFQKQSFTLGNSRVRPVSFSVDRVDILHSPVFSGQMRFRALSPICISASIPGRHAQYRHPEDTDYQILLRENLMNKLAIAQHYDFSARSKAIEEIPFEIALLSEPKRKGITLKAFTAAETKVIGYFFDFEIKAAPVLLEVGYYAGFGVENAQGFGCVAEIERH